MELDIKSFNVDKEYFKERISGLMQAKVLKSSTRRISSLKREEYSEEHILYTIDRFREDIERHISNKRFENNEHKVNYIFKIILTYIDESSDILDGILNMEIPISEISFKEIEEASERSQAYKEFEEYLKNKGK